MNLVYMSNTFFSYLLIQEINLWNEHNIFEEKQKLVSLVLSHMEKFRLIFPFSWLFVKPNLDNYIICVQVWLRW